MSSILKGAAIGAGIGAVTGGVLGGLDSAGTFDKALYAKNLAEPGTGPDISRAVEVKDFLSLISTGTVPTGTTTIISNIGGFLCEGY